MHPSDPVPDLQAAIEAASRLVGQCHGANIDPIVDALDAHLLDDAGQVRQDVVGQLRPDLAMTLDLRAGEPSSGRQVAAQLLCAADDFRAPITAADMGIADLVSGVAVTLFGALHPSILPYATVLAALVAVRGLPAFCDEMGRPLTTDRQPQIT